ncbi:MAG: hypothetical protein CVV21_08905 [Candidatus Goldiibacteriota bacterium HGW-Goldbacteria-1]|jgi:uncharacterized protein YdeI (BOF family)|nr:MAG: hypothetical protein CVV21_08905 [Candidatus Goldiibacteriota bacterium HGW-Goldbacteria-1]
MKRLVIIALVLVLAVSVMASQEGKEKKNIPNGQGQGLIKNGTIEPTPTPGTIGSGTVVEEIETVVEEIIRY